MDKADTYCYTSLHYAAQKNFTSIVEYLLQRGALPDGADTSPCTPLHRAAFAGETRRLRLRGVAPRLRLRQRRG